ncbi:MAG: hypothetical protein JWM64_1331 [Frankiales bacterium]|nr:hypothetical protein [Frankiales bacterium]
MRAPAVLRRLDRRVLGEPKGPRRSLARDLVGSVARVAQIVLIVLAVLLVLGIAAVVLPTDEDNVLVKGVLDGALQVAGPFATVFDVERRELRAGANYGLAAVVYLVLAKLVGRLARKT